MSTTYDLPMPGDPVEACTVIASRWGNDTPEDGPVFGEAILLGVIAPFYAVAQIMQDDERNWYVHTTESVHFHITEAADAYGEG